jgi:nucleoside-diphosphate-sugar epimerase
MFIFGAGYSGRTIARLVKQQGGWAGGTTRSADKAERLGEAGIEPLLFDGAQVSAEIAEALQQTTHLVVSIAPDHGMREAGGAAALTGGVCVDPVLSALGHRLSSMAPALRWIGYLSTVGVYGDHDGAWIDEEAQCHPTSRRSIMRLDAEHEWLALGAQIGLPVAVLRLSGIYGPGRNALVNLDSGTARRIVKEGQIFNRIHVDDIAGATVQLAEREIGGVFNVTDDEPAPPQDVVAFAAGLMGMEPPPEIRFEEADMSPMARSFYGENKRISNARLKQTGYALQYPTYRNALAALWQHGDWRGR